MVPSCHGKKHCIGTSRAAIGWRKRGGVFMLSIALYLLTHAMLLSLHLSGGSFPRPLSAQEEKKYVERMLAGDIEARNVLVEHNLRLVAHIAKNSTPSLTSRTISSPSAPSVSSRAFRATARKRVRGSRPTLPNAWRILSSLSGTIGG